MRVGPVTAEQAGGRCALAAEVDAVNGGVSSFRLEISWPASLGVAPSTRIDPFAAALLIPAMALGEDLELQGPLSPSLRQNLERAIELLVGWNEANEFGRLHAVRLHAERLEEAPAGQPRHGLFFTGGVDSFHALLELDRAGNRPDALIFIHGFDIPLQRRALFAAIQRRLAGAARQEGFELTAVSTNLRQLTDPIVSWELEHGAGLAFAGLALGGGFSRCTIASADAYVDGAPYGTHASLDPLWSREGLRFETVGAGKKRSEKLAELAAAGPFVREHLRVCYLNRGGAYNCGHCPKCVRTMVQLHSLSLLGRFPALPQSIDVADLEPMIEPPRRLFLWHDAVALLRRSGDRPELTAAVERLIRRSEAVRDLPPWRCLFRRQGHRLLLAALTRRLARHATPRWRRRIRFVRRQLGGG